MHLFSTKWPIYIFKVLIWKQLEMISQNKASNQRRHIYLSFFPVASIKVIDLHDDVILFPCEPLHREALIRHPGHWAQNVITEERQQEVTRFSDGSDQEDGASSFAFKCVIK